VKILMLHTQGSGIGSYRHWSPAGALRRRGHEVWTKPEGGIEDLGGFLSEKMAWADVVHTGFSVDADYLRNLATARNYALLGLGRSVPLIVDCDDDLLHVPAYNVGFRGYIGTPETKAVALLGFRLADAMTVTMPWLARVYAPYNDHITVLPNLVHAPDWAGLPVDPQRAQSEDVRIVFAGGIGRSADLDMIREPLERIMRTRPQVRLFFMAMMPDWAAEQWARDPSNPRANRAFFIGATDILTYRRTMCWLGADIALAPVLPNDFNRGKSAIKVLESAMYGAAAVCSDWETYADVPSEAVLKASTEYEWTESLLALVDDPTLRARKVAACRAFVLATCNIDTGIPAWENCYAEAMARPVVDDAGTGIKSDLAPLPPLEEPAAIANSQHLSGRGQTRRLLEPEIPSRPDHRRG
jgi:hypothetical protein